MKEIKAYVQRDAVNSVVDELPKAGAPGITIVETHVVGYGYERSGKPVAQAKKPME